MRRHPSLQIKRPNILEKQRKAAATRKLLERHLDLFDRAMKDNKIQVENLWNMDEKGFLMGQVNRVKVICKRGRGTPISQVDGSREWITVLEAVSATGISLPACIIWKGKYHLAGKYIPGIGQLGTRFACTPNGWTSNELAVEWLQLHFEPYKRPRYARTNCTCLYITDNLIENRINGVF